MPKYALKHSMTRFLKNVCQHQNMFLISSHAYSNDEVGCLIQTPWANQPFGLRLSELLRIGQTDSSTLIHIRYLGRYTSLSQQWQFILLIVVISFLLYLLWTTSNLILIILMYYRSRNLDTSHITRLPNYILIFVAEIQVS